MSQAIPTEALQAKLTQSLKDLYPLALQADEQLEQLQEEQKGRFSAIFQADSGFTTQANRFLPYLVELSDEVLALSVMDADNQPAKIQGIVQKIQLMNQLLSRFHSIRDEAG